MRGRFWVATAGSMLALACGSSDTATSGGAGGGGSDGKYHPAANGQAESEADACAALADAFTARFKALACVGTTRQCPDLLRTEFGQDCLKYDEGTVEGCVAYYDKQTTCSLLNTAIADCAVEPIAGSAGEGCP